jgi:hypothetical protein
LSCEVQPSAEGHDEQSRPAAVALEASNIAIKASRLIRPHLIADVMNFFLSILLLSGEYEYLRFVC